MNRIASFYASRWVHGWWFVVAFSVLMAVAVGWGNNYLHRQQRLSLLQTEAQRSSIEVMAQTVNGNLMGSLTLLGLIDRDIKQEVYNGLLSQDAHIDVTLSTLGNSFGAQGVFVVGGDGIVKTSWDKVGKPSTGLDVGFRPYYQMALRGQSSVYAAVSMARGDRSLYFSAPVFTERARATTGIGAVVARTDLNIVDALLLQRFDAALLLSPQGVVFASSRSEWVGGMDGAPTPDRLQAIRALKQFGPLFEKADPQPLPIPLSAGVRRLEGKTYAVAAADVGWNDPSGPWRLVVLEDLGRSVAIADSLLAAAVAAVISMLLGWMWLHLVRGHHAQEMVTAQLKDYVHRQDAHVKYRADLAAALLRLQLAQTLESLAQEFLSCARHLLGAHQGVVYTADPDAPDMLLLAGSAACAEPPADRLILGEGLLGQCALAQEVRVLDTPLGGRWTIRSGLGNSPALGLMMAPLLIQGRLIGAVELALLQPPNAAMVAKFEELLAALANTLEILRRHGQHRELAQENSLVVEDMA